MIGSMGHMLGWTWYLLFDSSGMEVQVFMGAHRVVVPNIRLVAILKEA